MRKMLGSQPNCTLGVVAGFNWSGSPAATKITASQAAPISRFTPALPVAKLAAEFVIRHNAHAHFVGYEDHRAGELGHGVGESRDRERPDPGRPA